MNIIYYLYLSEFCIINMFLYQFNMYVICYKYELCLQKFTNLKYINIFFPLHENYYLSIVIIGFKC